MSEMLAVCHIIRLAAPLGCILAFSVQKTKEKKKSAFFFMTASETKTHHTSAAVFCLNLSADTNANIMLELPD